MKKLTQRKTYRKNKKFKKIENKKTEIHYEKRKNNPDWAKIDKMISEREALEDKYRDKELKFETNYAKK